MQFICPTDPVQSPIDVTVEICTACFLQCKQSHRGHTMLMHRIHGIMLHDAARFRIIVPPPLTQRTLPAIATMPAPQDLSATLCEDGVVLTWTSGGEPHAVPGVQYRYRIYRRLGDAGEPSAGKNKDTIAGEVVMREAGPAR